MATRPGRRRCDPESLARRKPEGQSRCAESDARRRRPEGDRRLAERPALRQPGLRAGLGRLIVPIEHKKMAPGGAIFVSAFSVAAMLDDHDMVVMGMPVPMPAIFGVRALKVMAAAVPDDDSLSVGD